jgi:hypothetical protein
MEFTLAKFSGSRSASPKVVPNRSSRKTTSLSRLSESRMPLSSSGVSFASGSSAGSGTSSWLM